MDTYRYACVVDSEGGYVDMVLLIDDVVQRYTMQPRENLVDAPCPTAVFCRPRWTGTTWEETATPEELAAWEAKRNPPRPEPTPDPADTISALQQQVADLQAQMAALTGGEA